MDQYLSQFGDDLGGVILGPGRGTSVDNHHIPLPQGVRQGSFDLLAPIGDNGVNLRQGAKLLYQSRQHYRIEFDDAARGTWPVSISGTEISSSPVGMMTTPGAAPDQQPGHARGQEGAHGIRGDLGLFRQDHFMGHQVFPDLARTCCQG